MVELTAVAFRWLYERIIDLYDCGGAWEQAIACSKELQQQHETQSFDFTRVKAELVRQGTLFSKLADEERSPR